MLILAIRRGGPFRDLISLQERMNRLFEESLSSFGEKEEKLFPGTWSPAIDIYETPEELIIKAELPGIDISDIDIEIKDNTLFLKGERRFEKRVTEENYHRMEMSYGPFQRSFTLPNIVQHTKTKAKLKDGILEIILPKTEIKKTKKIEVEIK